MDRVFAHVGRPQSEVDVEVVRAVTCECALWRHLVSTSQTREMIRTYRTPFFISWWIIEDVHLIKLREDFVTEEEFMEVIDQRTEWIAPEPKGSA